MIAALCYVLSAFLPVTERAVSFASPVDTFAQSEAPSWFEFWIKKDTKLDDLYSLVRRSYRFQIKVRTVTDAFNREFEWVSRFNSSNQVFTRILYIPTSAPRTLPEIQQTKKSLERALAAVIVDLTLKDWIKSNDQISSSKQLVECYRDLLFQGDLDLDARKEVKKEILRNRRIRVNSPLGKQFLITAPEDEPTFGKLKKLLESYHLRNDLELPKSVREIIYDEQVLNEMGKIQVYHSPLKSDLNRVFRASEQNIFELPYITLKEDEVKALGRFFPAEALVPNGGYRFFIHPQSFSAFAGLLRTHPLKYDGYVATALASGRSLYAWKVSNPDGTLFSPKTGLASTIGTVKRNIPPEEVLHATMMSEGLSEIPTRYFEEIKLTPFFEPAGLVVEGYECGLIFKELGDVASGYHPFFSLYASVDGAEPLLIRLARVAGEDPIEYAKTSILEPLIAGLARLYSDYGFIPEPHTQNMLIQIKDDRVVGFGFRDLSGVAVDTDLRTLRGLKNDFMEIAKKQFPSFFKPQYHNERGATYLDRGIETHFKRGLLEGMDWIIPPARNGKSASAILEQFSDRTFKSYFKKYIGVPKIQTTRGWSYGVREAISKSRSMNVTSVGLKTAPIGRSLSDPKKRCLELVHKVR